MSLEPLLIVPDSHRPWHDKRAWNLMLRVGRFLKPKHLFVIGDLADFYSVSSHSKDPARKQDLEWEVDDVRKGLDELDALGAAHKRFIAGNHEDRLVRYLREKAPELFGLVSIPQLFGLKERGWDYTPYKSDARIGKAYITHDVGATGRNATFRALDTYQHTIITGHAHRMQYIVEGNAVGEYKLSAQFGWLGDAAKIDYMHRANVAKNWALGFGIGYVNTSNGIVYLVPIPLVRYTCCVHGKLFEG